MPAVDVLRHASRGRCCTAVGALKRKGSPVARGGGSWPTFPGARLAVKASIHLGTETGADMEAQEESEGARVDQGPDEDLPGDPGAKTPLSQFRGSRFDPWSGN